MASEIILIAKVAEVACATAVNDPGNLGARADLLNAVEAFVDAAGQKAVLNTQPISNTCFAWPPFWEISCVAASSVPEIAKRLLRLL
jgi:hypothetical protein